MTSSKETMAGTKAGSQGEADQGKSQDCGCTKEEAWGCSASKGEIGRPGGVEARGDEVSKEWEGRLSLSSKL